MKRKDLVVGERYAVFAPSQREKGYMFSEYHAKSMDIVTVVSVEPRYLESYSRDREAGVFAGDDGKAYPYDRDSVFRIPDKSLPEYKGRSWGARPGSFVLAVGPMQYGRETTELRVVPLANIAMTEAEYLERVAQHTRMENQVRINRQKAAEKAEEDRKRLIAERDALEELLDTDNVRVRILDGALALTGDLELFVQQARSDARVLEYLCNEDGALESRIVDLQVALATKENA